MRLVQRQPPDLRLPLAPQLVGVVDLHGDRRQKRYGSKQNEAGGQPQGCGPARVATRHAGQNALSPDHCEGRASARSALIGRRTPSLRCGFPGQPAAATATASASLTGFFFFTGVGISMSTSSVETESPRSILTCTLSASTVHVLRDDGEDLLAQQRDEVGAAGDGALVGEQDLQPVARDRRRCAALEES